VRDSPAYPFQLILFLLYGCGLRVSEPLGVRIRDLDLGNRRVIIRQAKGSKDRMVPIPPLLIPAIQQQIQAARTVWQRAVAEGVPVQLPGQLGRKYRNAGHEFGWWWLFPMENGCVDPRTKVRVWWHCLESTVQRAMKQACQRAQVDTTITPHHLRHAWATHVIDDGARIRDVQEILGHKSLETTMIYVHDEIERVKSPLDAAKTLRLMGGAA
jgi:site-specific recombinase XerD